jgi:hypothetical protein
MDYPMKKVVQEWFVLSCMLPDVLFFGSAPYLVERKKSCHQTDFQHIETQITLTSEESIETDAQLRFSGGLCTLFIMSSLCVYVFNL